MNEAPKLLFPTEVLLLTARLLGPWDLINLAQAFPELKYEYKPKYWVQITDRGGDNILHIAAAYGMNDLTPLILKPGDLSAQNESGLTALHRACENGHADSARLLLEKGVDSNISTVSGVTAIHLAASAGATEIVSNLIQRGANLASRSQGDYTVLHWAVNKQQYEVTSHLIREGVKLDSRDAQGWSPLHWAAYQGDAQMVEMLLQAGADPNIHDNDHYTPSDLALHQGQNMIALRLKRSKLGFYSLAGWLHIVKCMWQFLMGT